MPSGKGHDRPASSNRFNASRTVERAMPSRRAISCVDTPQNLSRIISRASRIPIRSAGIDPPLGLPKGRPDQANGGARQSMKDPGRDHSVMGGAIISESGGGIIPLRGAASSRNWGAASSGISNLPFWRAFGIFLEGLATAQGSTASGGHEATRRGIELLREQNLLLFDGLAKIAFAETEARAGDLERAVASLDEALATCERIGHRTFEAELHRVRGEMLLNRDPANAATAGEALHTAIAVSQRQGTRSFELRAALALAKLYQSTGCPAEAHAVLAPALYDFAPTREMPEIAEAQTLLSALAATGEVKAEAAHRQRLTQLHVSYGNALIAARGYGAPETTEAFAKARESASGDK